jgi:hypothetical protein
MSCRRQSHCAIVRNSRTQSGERTGQRLGPKGLLEVPIGTGGRSASSCGGLGAVTSGGAGFFAGFCCVSFPPLPFFRCCCFTSAGAEAKTFVTPAGTAFGWAATGAPGLAWPAIGVSGATAADWA